MAFLALLLTGFTDNLCKNFLTFTLHLKLFQYNNNEMKNEVKVMIGFIYKVENKINGKKYIGLTTQTSLKARYSGSIENTHNEHLKRSIEKYGLRNFEIVEFFDTAETLEELNQKEMYYIEKYNTTNPQFGYNKSNGGNGIGQHTEETKKIMRQKAKRNFGEDNYFFNKRFYAEENGFFGKKHTQETKSKLSFLKKGKPAHENTLKALSKKWYGPKHSEETKKKIGNIHRGKKYSDETKQKISDNHGRKRQIIVIDESGNQTIYDTVRKAMDGINCHHVTKYANGHNSHIWKTKNLKIMYFQDYIKEENQNDNKTLGWIR